MKHYLISFVKIKKILIMVLSKILPVIFITLSFSSCKKSHNHDEDVVAEFQKTFGGPENDFGNSIVVSADQQLFCFGTTSSLTNGGKDFYLIKTTTSGNLIYEKHFGGSGDETGYSVMNSPDGGIVMAGSTTGSGSGNFDMYVVKAGLQGSVVYEKFYGTADDETATCIIATGNSGYLIGGFRSAAGSGRDFYLVRTDQAGNEMWSKTYGGAADDFINSLAYVVNAQQEDEFLVFGNTRSHGAGDQDFYLMKINASGDSLWGKTYGTASYEQAGSIIQDAGGFYLCGHSAGHGHAEHNVYLVRTDLSGNMIWENNYGGALHDGSEQGLLASNGDILMTGYSSSYGAGDVDFMLMRVKTGGQLVSTRVFGSLNENVAFSIAETGDAYYMTGYEKSGPGNKSNLMLAKVKK